MATIPKRRTNRRRRPIVLVDLSAILNHPFKGEAPFAQELEKFDADSMVAILRAAIQEKFFSVAKGIIKHASSKIRPFELAIVQGDLDTVEWFMLEHQTFQGPEWEGFFPWLFIFETMDTATSVGMLQLFCLNPFLRSRTDERQSLLHLLTTVINGDVVKLAEVLVNIGFPVDDEDAFGVTPLILACNPKNAPLAKFLVERGADVNHVDSAGRSPLLLAIWLEHVDLIDLFLSSGAVDVNAVTPHNTTPLILACCYARPLSIAALFRNGADVSVECGGTTAFRNLNPADEDCVILVVKELARRKFEELDASDFPLLKRFLTAFGHFNNCMEELGRMAGWWFFGSHSYYTVLNMRNRLRMLARLQTNPGFMEKFEADVADFPYYIADLRWVMHMAAEVRIQLDEVKRKLDGALGDFFPDLVKKNLAKFLTVEDLSALG